MRGEKIAKDSEMHFEAQLSNAKFWERCFLRKQRGDGEVLSAYALTKQFTTARTLIYDIILWINITRGRRVIVHKQRIHNMKSKIPVADTSDACNKLEGKTKKLAMKYQQRHSQISKEKEEANFCHSVCVGSVGNIGKHGA